MCAQIRKVISRLGSSTSSSSSGGRAKKAVDPGDWSFMGELPATPEPVKEEGRFVHVYVKDANHNTITFGIKVSPSDPRFEIRKLNFVLKVGNRMIEPNKKKPNEKENVVLTEKVVSKKETVSLGKPIETTVTVPYDTIWRNLLDRASEGLEIDYQVDLDLGIIVLWEFVDIVIPISAKGKIMIPNLCQIGKSTVINCVNKRK
ncbi:uncharacterized protein LOC127814283 [Diospyros lotus]|uniref:uncharacterized protein LOC127814283 n=1 Tax=Diospyros lotus TaxID=55363 RepID=UPI00224DA939|nr:uncharacterized protein LOC127814283 [Diospyros lotus]